MLWAEDPSEKYDRHDNGSGEQQKNINAACKQRDLAAQEIGIVKAAGVFGVVADGDHFAADHLIQGRALGNVEFGGVLGGLRVGPDDLVIR